MRNCLLLLLVFNLFQVNDNIIQEIFIIIEKSRNWIRRNIKHWMPKKPFTVGKRIEKGSERRYYKQNAIIQIFDFSARKTAQNCGRGTAPIGGTTEIERCSKFSLFFNQNVTFSSSNNKIRWLPWNIFCS